MPDHNGLFLEFSFTLTMTDSVLSVFILATYSLEMGLKEGVLATCDLR